MDYHRNTDYLKGTIFPVLENYEYTNNIENVLKQMESACIDKTNITFDKNEYYFKFTGTYGQITVFPLSKYLERNFSLQKRSNNKFCIDSAIFYSLQYDWKIGITLLDGKWNDDVYIHCYNYNQSNDLVIDDLGAEKGIVMPREDYLKILKTNDSKETYFTTIERNEVINDYISREPKLLKYKIPN